MQRMRHLLSVVLVLGCGLVAQAQDKGDPSKLTLERIFGTNEFRGQGGGGEWLAGREGYTTLEPSATVKGGNDIVYTAAASGEKEVLVKAESLKAPGASSSLHPAGYDFSADQQVVLIFTNTKKVWRQNTRGDYWVLDRKANKLTKLGGDAKASTLMFAKLSPDGKRVGYVRENNIYVQDWATGQITQITRDGSEHIINGTFDWVYEEELDCRDGWRWSPDGQSIAYWQLDTTGVPVFSMIDNTEGMYPKVINFAYPKTGEKNSACRVGIIPAGGGETRWVSLSGDSREHYIARMEWTKDSSGLILQRLNRLQNEKHVLRVEAKTGSGTTLQVEKDSCWVDIHDNGLVELADRKGFTWVSEHDGWRKVYLMGWDKDFPQCLTPMSYDVANLLHVDKADHSLYFLAAPENPTQRYLYRANSEGQPRRVTPADQAGMHRYDISPDGKWAFHSWSTFGTPPRTEVISLPDHKTLRVLADNAKLREKVDALAKTPVEFFRVDNGEGTMLDGWLMKPPGFDPAKKYPLFFYVYGEPWGQTVQDGWASSQYLWHLYLTQQGYLVASIDNRGTNVPRGRDWRKSVYQKIGVIASKDQAAAAKELLKRPYVDSKRVGIWGWSGGGSMTLNMLFRYPDLYHTGIAVASVPDMRLYDTIYQERYMGLPQQGAEAYKSGSPITYAGQLKGNLLLVHGTGDDNVHYQGVEKLMDVLIAANKPFSMMAYPNRSHGISEGRGTTRHLYEMMTRYLFEKLPSGPR
jgi:dipeptidyl-peptidase 4